MTKPVVVQDWLECDRDGQDLCCGYSLHLTKKDFDKFKTQFSKTSENTQTFPGHEATVVDISDKAYDFLKRCPDKSYFVSIARNVKAAVTLLE